MTTQHYIEGYRRDLENEFTNSDTSGENRVCQDKLKARFNNLFGKACEQSLRDFARKNHPEAEDDYYNKAREYFCAKHTGFSSFLFCLQQVTPTPANQQIVPPVPQAPPPPQGPPPLTPEQQQQQAIMAQLTYTTPSGFIAENPGIIIGGAVLLLSALCFMAACAMSFLTVKSQKPAVPVKRGNQIRKPARHVHKNRKKSKFVNG
ncbi:hypothetical protein L5515_004282 [Caenorhabditis briggsae]|uniref:Uncharacterized protein n=1 Tax=Caenorhabditis briggsae TaxID=6238 RepID=A0AAE9EM32_CAEBR|nr:hypothetical protein L5515_004282 [Caenorhabditis briggsae]